MTDKRFCIAVTGAIIVSIAAIMLFNFIVDPAKIFIRERYAKGIVDILLANKNAANLGEHDDRLVQKYYMEQSGTAARVVTIGSSRVWTINKNYFPGSSFFNYNTRSAGMEDLVALYEMLLLNNKKPGMIIIGADPNILNRNNGFILWHTLGKEYRVAAKRLGFVAAGGNFVEDITVSKYRELLSLKYTMAAVQKALHGSMVTDAGYYGTYGFDSGDDMKHSDGSYRYMKKGSQSSVEDIKSAELNDRRLQLIGLNNFHSLDSEYKHIFELLVGDMLRSGIDVVFYLAPFNPVFYERYAADPKFAMVLEAEKYFKGLAASKGISIIGAYNPAECGLGVEAFYDALHVRENAFAHMLN